jgi:hypothetical protein
MSLINKTPLNQYQIFLTRQPSAASDRNRPGIERRTALSTAVEIEKEAL